MPKGIEYQVKVIMKFGIYSEGEIKTPEENLEAVVQKQAKHRWQVQAMSECEESWTVIFFRITRIKKEEFNF